MARSYLSLSTHIEKRLGQLRGAALWRLRRQFAATDARTLRSAVGTFCDLLGLATRTLETFERVAR